MRHVLKGPRKRHWWQEPRWIAWFVLVALTIGIIIAFVVSQERL